ncbi:MAG: NHL repeat-containing protein [Sphingomonadaceae bacterium]
MTSTQIKLAFAGLALFGAAVGGGVAFLLTRPGPAGESAEAGNLAPPPTKPGWSARVSLVAGDGLSGSINNKGARARFADPYGIVVDGDGNLYVADGGDGNAIRKIDSSGLSTTLAGGIEGYAEGNGKLAAFHTPSGIARDRKGNLYLADTGNNAIRRITPAGDVTTWAGDGLAGFRDGRGPAAQFNGPLGVAVAEDGTIYVADTYNDRIRRIAPDGAVSTIAGGEQAGNVDGPAAQARFDTPAALALAANGDLYIADTGNHAVRKLGKDGQVSTVARVTDEKDRNALLRRPVALAVSHDNYLYVASGAHGRIAQITPAGQVLPLVDVDHPPQPGFGPDGGVRLYAPRGLALGPDGALYVSDAGTFRLHRIAPPVAGQPAPAELVAPLPSHGATMLWPVKPQDKVHEVVGLLGEVRGNYEGDSRDHFHAGLDVQAAVGAPVLAVLPAKVSDPLAAWSVGELGEGMALEGMHYIHMKVGRGADDKALDPRFVLINDDKGKPLRVRVKRGTRFLQGDVLGSVNRMAHVHLDYRPNGDALNPLSLPFIDLEDTLAPTIQSITLLDAKGRTLKDKRGTRLLVPRLAGELQIVVDAYDQIEGNKAARRLGLYKLGYQLLDGEGQAIAGKDALITQQYDRLPRNRDAVKRAYAENSGITVYGSANTRFAYLLNTSVRQGRVTPGGWNVTDLAPGNYTLRILAEDYAGNAASKERDLAITVE